MAVNRWVRCDVFWISIYLLHCVNLTYSAENKIDCNKNVQCKCVITENGKTMHCNGNYAMNSIPFIRRNITNLIIKHGNFTVVNKETFEPIANSSVKFFHMIMSNIRTLTEDSFWYLRGVNTIDFSHNKYLDVLYVRNALHSLANTQITRTVIFTRMRWRRLPDDLFAGLVNTSISHIQLAHNFFTTINCSMFKDLSNLRNLNLGWTGLSNRGSNFHGLSRVRKLNLTGTWFTRFPHFCDKNNRSLVPNLQYLDLDFSKINSLSNHIRCLDSVIGLSLNGLCLRIIYPNTFSSFKQLQNLSLSNLGAQFRRVTLHAFNSSSLLSLKISVNRKAFFSINNNRNFIASEIFKYCSQLKVLDLSNNRFRLLNKTWNDMLSPLQHLTHLLISDTKVNYIPNIGGTLQQLLYLDLSENRISSWAEQGEENPFMQFKRLKWLNLKHNQISLINKTSFPTDWMNGRGTLMRLFLDGNPFSCTCGISWFRNWMDYIRDKNLTTDERKWKCLTSKNHVSTYYPEKTFVCQMPYFITGISILIFIFLVSLLVFILRFRIKLAFYKCSSRKKDYALLHSVDYEYDIFVSYSYKDVSWVKERAIPKLEQLHHVRLCIQDRDFKLGTIFSNAIIKAIRSSKCVMLIISDNFAKDEWCKFQLDITNFINICENNRIKIIPVMLEHEVSFKHMTEALYQIMNSGKYLKWNLGGAEEKVFWISMLDHISNCNLKKAINSSGDETRSTSELSDDFNNICDI